MYKYTSNVNVDTEIHVITYDDDNIIVDQYNTNV